MPTPPPQPPTAQSSSASDRGALAGIRVVDLSWVGVGPLTVKYLADHGAEVIRIESATRMEALRRAPPFLDGEPGQDRSGYYANFNSSKRCVSLNLSYPRAVGLVKQLVAQSDVVAESFSPKAMRAWSLSYDDLRTIKPDLVMISMPLYGQTGPWAEYLGFGHVLQGVAGLNHLTGWPDGEPIGPGIAYTDFFVPHFAATALLAALAHRERTGEGQHIEFAQLEAALYATEAMILDYTANGHEQMRMGNRHRQAAPHGCFRCAPRGDDDERWCVIACFTEEEWQAFLTAAGTSAWGNDPRFATLADRLANQDALEGLIEGWTRPQAAEAIMTLLQEHNVPAGVVQSAEDLRNDPQINHRQHFWFLDHDIMGRRCYDGPTFRLSKTPGRLTKAAPALGADNEYVLKELLGISDEEYVELLLQGVLE